MPQLTMTPLGFGTNIGINLSGWRGQITSDPQFGQYQLGDNEIFSRVFSNVWDAMQIELKFLRSMGVRSVVMWGLSLQFVNDDGSLKIGNVYNLESFLGLCTDLGIQVHLVLNTIYSSYDPAGLFDYQIILDPNRQGPYLVGMNLLATRLKNQDCLVSFDMMNECNGLFDAAYIAFINGQKTIWTGNNQNVKDFFNALRVALKSGAPNKLVTASWSGLNQLALATYLDTTNPYVDFHDIHRYVTNLTYGDQANYYKDWPALPKQLIVGECGITTPDLTDSQGLPCDSFYGSSGYPKESTEECQKLLLSIYQEWRRQSNTLGVDTLFLFSYHEVNKLWYRGGYRLNERGRYEPFQFKASLSGKWLYGEIIK